MCINSYNCYYTAWAINGQVMQCASAYVNPKCLTLYTVGYIQIKNFEQMLCFVTIQIASVQECMVIFLIQIHPLYYIHTEIMHQVSID